MSYGANSWQSVRTERTDRRGWHGDGLPVAIKKLKADLAQPEIIARFQREGELLRELDHPNIVKILDIIEEDAQHYLIIEFVPGGDLNARIKHGQLEIEQVLRLSIDLADALTRAHKLDIIHRDLKPANVLLTDTGTLRLTDFGIAHEGSRERVTDPSVIVGTVDYLPPEAIRGETLDQRADIWAFGVMLLEMLTGQRPFSDKSISATIMRILTGALPDLETLRPDAPVALVDLVYRMLARDREARIRSVRQVGLELEDLLHNRQTPAVRDRFATPTPDVTVVDRPKHNLPASSSGFVGREEELASLGRLLDNANTHLVTILAPGGMGKTRLALEAANQQIDHFAFPDGVYFVELAPLSSVEYVAPAIADAIGVQFAEGSDPRPQLLNAIRHRKLLLVLDNFEHLLDGVDIVRDILQAAKNIKIVVTSRERLNLSVETMFLLSGMDFPDWETPEDALNYSAVKLFLQSATQARPDFELTADELRFLARICRLVAGMPLGIVLTAAWVNMLSLAEIAGEIERSLDFLETDMRDIPERQRSIRGIFDYSYGRLSADEQTVFRKLSVFRGGLTRDAAQQVAGATLKTLMALMNQSLLRRNPDGRYQIHELLRQYGTEQLNKAGETATVQEAHALYYAQFLQRLWIDLQGRRQLGALAEIDPEFENIRVSWNWLVEHRRRRKLGDAASSLWLYLDVAGRYLDGIDLFGQAAEILRFEAIPDDELWILGHLLGRLAWCQGYVGQFEKCKAAESEALAILQGADRPEPLVTMLYTISHSDVYLVLLADLMKIGEEASRINRAGLTAWAIRLAVALRGLGLFLTGSSEGLKILEECAAQSLAAGDLWTASSVWLTLGYAVRELKQYQDVERYCRQSLPILEIMHSQIAIAETYNILGGSLAHQGRLAESKVYAHRAIKLRYGMGHVWHTLVCTLSSAEEYFLQANKPLAVELISMILNHPACNSSLSGWTEKTIVVLKAELSPEVYDAAWQRGRAWDFDQAVAFVLKQLE